MDIPKFNIRHKEALPYDNNARRKSVLLACLTFSMFIITCYFIASYMDKWNQALADRKRNENKTEKFNVSFIANTYNQIGPIYKVDSSRVLVDPTYSPGNLTVQENGLLLSTGLKSRIIARSGQLVEFANGSKSTVNFHSDPDAAATYEGPNNTWIYVSNSEVRDSFNGGVGALTFNADGDVIDYQMVLSNSRANCGGGKTTWDVSNIFSISFQSIRLIGYLWNHEFIHTFHVVPGLDLWRRI